MGYERDCHYGAILRGVLNEKNNFNSGSESPGFCWFKFIARIRNLQEAIQRSLAQNS
jgi:hypothetical protein